MLDCIDVIYDRLEVNPFSILQNVEIHILPGKGIEKQLCHRLNYIIIFDVRDDVVNVVGIFHQLENYQNKL